MINESCIMNLSPRQQGVIIVAFSVFRLIGSLAWRPKCPRLCPRVSAGALRVFRYGRAFFAPVVFRLRTGNRRFLFLPSLLQKSPRSSEPP